MKTTEGLSHIKDFTRALTLQKKMPVSKRILKACAALDPSVRMTSTSQRYLQSLADTRIVDKADEEQYTKRVVKYTTSPRIDTAAPGIPIDAFRVQIDISEYSLQAGVVRKLATLHMFVSFVLLKYFLAIVSENNKALLVVPKKKRRCTCL